MNGYLKQSTASQSRLIGPFVSDSDFKTVQTGLTIANTDVKLRANGTTLSNKNSGGGTHQVNGMYSLTWDATDTANVGELSYSVLVTGALVITGTYVVLEEVVYDALYGASAPGYPSATDNADALLTRDWTAVATPAARSVLNALRFIRNKFSTTATPGQVTIYKEDDTTVAYTKSVTTDATAQPIVQG